MRRLFHFAFTFKFRALVKEKLKFSQGKSGKSKGISESIPEETSVILSNFLVKVTIRLKFGVTEENINFKGKVRKSGGNLEKNIFKSCRSQGC